MRLWKAGTILIPKSGASTFVNHRVILGLDAHVSSHLATIQAEPTRCDGRYLLYYLSTVKAQDLIQDQSYPSLKLPEIAGIEIPLPPLAEQKRIVALLDEAFAGIDEAKAKAEERKLLSGELSDACLESFLSDDSGWTTTTVSECADINTGFAFKSSGFSKSSTDVRLLGGDNIINGAIRWENIRRWPKGDSQNYQNFFLSAGDIVLAMDRPIVNSGLKIAMVCADDLPALLIQRTARLRAKHDVSADFLYLALNSSRFINHLNNSQKGVGVPHVSARQIGSFSIKLPPRHEHERITTLLSKIISSTAHVALNSTRAWSNLSELRQSLLTQAFAGELAA
jgi:type I restriction enzyme S subunit